MKTLIAFVCAICTLSFAVNAFAADKPEECEKEPKPKISTT